jgi:hypothetical protein
LYAKAANFFKLAKKRAFHFLSTFTHPSWHLPGVNRTGLLFEILIFTWNQVLLRSL